MGALNRLRRSFAPLNDIMAAYDVRGSELRDAFDDLHHARLRNATAWRKRTLAGAGASIVLLPEVAPLIILIGWSAAGVSTVRGMLTEYKPIDRNRALINRAISNRRALGG